MTTKRVIQVRNDTEASILENPDASSLKRIAWAYGCSKKDSPGETALRAVLIHRAQREDIRE